MLTVLKNSNCSLTISTLGAEPQSFILNGIEYIWNGDKAHWPRRAPLLFPVTGPLREDSVAVNGVQYKMPGNGFARDTEFTLVSTTDDSATYVLTDNEYIRI